MSELIPLTDDDLFAVAGGGGNSGKSACGCEPSTTTTTKTNTHLNIHWNRVSNISDSSAIGLSAGKVTVT
jgi:hypothetical protein